VRVGFGEVETGSVCRDAVEVAGEGGDAEIFAPWGAPDPTELSRRSLVLARVASPP
jgi:hypothetical protein